MIILKSSKSVWLPLGAVLVLAVAVLGMDASRAAAEENAVNLSGSQEVPPVESMGSGSGEIMVSTSGAVTGSVTTEGLAGTAAHIHMAAEGMNGPVVIPLTKNGDTYTVPAGTQFTDAQHSSYKEGHMYVNVHTEANGAGEIRGQLKP